MNTHVMLDIETLGTDSKSLVLSISAVEFTLGGETGRKFEMALPVLEQLLHHEVVVDMSTICWWKTQNEEAKREIKRLKPAKTVVQALIAFNMFLEQFGKNVSIWGNGATFDNTIVRNLYKSFNVDFIVPFWCDKDVRTIVSLIDYETVNKRAGKFNGIKHRGIDDCLHQVKLVAEGLKFIKGY